MCIKLSPLAISIGLALLASQTVSAAESETDSAELESITVTASADASAEGLSPAFAGGQVAEGGRAGSRPRRAPGCPGPARRAPGRGFGA